MDLSKYKVGSFVRIDLRLNGYFYQGIVLEVDKNSISLKDKKGQLVTLSEDSILFIREVLS